MHEIPGLRLAESRPIDHPLTIMSRSTVYQQDLAWIHHVGFGDFARGAGRELLQSLRRGGVRGETLIDLGCGSGIWAAMAERAGFRVVGVDRSAAMIALAKRESPKSEFVRASLDEFPLPPCAAVTALGESFNYGAGTEAIDLRRLFARIARALRPGGRFVFDVIIHEGEPMNYRTWRVGPVWALLVDVKEDRRRRTLARHIITFRTGDGRIRRSEEHHAVQCFRRAEVERALRVSGFRFRVSRRYGRMPLAPRRLAFIATNPPRPARARR